MRLMTCRFFSLTLALVISILLITDAYGEKYPSRPVRLVVPVSPGATTDTLARFVAQELSKSLGVQFVVENKAGGSGVIGTEEVTKAAPDGYTLLIITSTHTINPNVNKNLPYDPLKSFSLITHLVSNPVVLLVNPAVPARTIQELIVLSKTKTLSYGSGGHGAPTHLVGELFNSVTGARLKHVAYKGGGPANIAVLGGEVEVKFNSGVQLQKIKDGSLRALGVTTLTRNPLLPDVPTIAESGFPGFEFGGWYAILGPAGIAPEKVNFLHSEISKALSADSVKSFVANEGGLIVAGGPQQLREHMSKELKKYQQIFAGLKSK